MKSDNPEINEPFLIRMSPPFYAIIAPLTKVQSDSPFIQAATRLAIGIN
jgi:hypothetical protein